MSSILKFVSSFKAFSTEVLPLETLERIFIKDFSFMFENIYRSCSMILPDTKDGFLTAGLLDESSGFEGNA